MMRTFRKTNIGAELDETSYIDIEDRFYSETIVDDGSGFGNPGGWYECNEGFIESLLEMGYEEMIEES